MNLELPKEINNWINGSESRPSNGQFFDKKNPHNSETLFKVAQSQKTDVSHAIESAKVAQAAWGTTTGVARGDLLYKFCDKLIENKELVAKIVALETGKALNDARGEVGAAIALGRFMAAEGQRLFGRTTASGATNRYPIIIREPVGVAGLIIAANTPIANIAWKAFPSMICGNASIVKSSEDTPMTSWVFAKLATEAGIPNGVLNVIQGYGKEAGAALVESNDVQLVSFTGSTAVGKWISKVAGERLAKTCMELGGKNALVVCDDANMDNALKWSLLSSFSNAGQRCAASSRIIVFESIYDEFKTKFVEATKKLKMGPTDDHQLGPVINERQLNNMCQAVEQAASSGAKILCGGTRATDSELAKGYYMQPTILENVSEDAPISRNELFGPITILYRAKNFADALRMTNNSDFGLTASIHTSNIHRAVEFGRKAQVGVACINGGTHGSEPHMPFGGVKQSGNGWREPGPEAIDVYSNVKTIYEMILPDLL